MTRLYIYAVLYHPANKVEKDAGEKTVIICEPKALLAESEEKAKLQIAHLLPDETDMSRVEILVRPF